VCSKNRDEDIIMMAEIKIQRKRNRRRPKKVNGYNEGLNAKI